MADIAAFPTIHDVLAHEGLMMTYVFTETTKAGQVVGTAATAVSGAVSIMNATADEQPMGVALYDVTAGDKGVVCMNGCVVEVAINDQTTGCEQGDILGPASFAGSIVKIALGIKTADTYYSGIALEDIVGNGTGKMLVSVGVFLDGTD